MLQTSPLRTVNKSTRELWSILEEFVFPFKSQLHCLLLTSRLCMPLLGRDPGYLVHLEVPEYLIRSEGNQPHYSSVCQ